MEKKEHQYQVPLIHLQPSAFGIYDNALNRRRNSPEKLLHRIPSGRKLETLNEDAKTLTQPEKREDTNSSENIISEDACSSTDTPSSEILDRQFEELKERLEKTMS